MGLVVVCVLVGWVERIDPERYGLTNYYSVLYTLGSRGVE